MFMSEARSDPELLNLRDELAMARAHLYQLLETLGSNDGPGAWGKARAAVRRLKSARSERGRASAIRQLDEALDAAAAERKTWKAIEAAMDQVRRLSAAELRRMVKMRELIPTEEAMLFAQTLLIAVRDNVKDPEVLQRIQDTMNVTLDHHWKERR